MRMGVLAAHLMWNLEVAPITVGRPMAAPRPPLLLEGTEELHECFMMFIRVKKLESGRNAPGRRCRSAPQCRTQPGEVEAGGISLAATGQGDRSMGNDARIRNVVVRPQPADQGRRGDVLRVRVRLTVVPVHQLHSDAEVVQVRHSVQGRHPGVPGAALSGTISMTAPFRSMMKWLDVSLFGLEKELTASWPVAVAVA